MFIQELSLKTVLIAVIVDSIWRNTMIYEKAIPADKKVLRRAFLAFIFSLMKPLTSKGILKTVFHTTRITNITPLFLFF